ncbi:MAG: polymerase beta domain protein region protein [Candidatus Roizmanbacteria bacterium GW2011_GWA2_35_19]|uniref:Polymerase beta domain protein region protein n=2 Tax=Candidatus Roizmaniibacteriota TaxID=1752723 RepID=A0A0G0BQD5_9BACT|nr:MAG: polymerase beta domain protein region protein [Candidatus Roizmanbacteria bacterium GW2011_GWC2_35_12]KKP71583.1 MAG: polymerase beta domain protein region protein [Candidatus Roizmanbacteria bacterium GW2011_GWA2_35_19]
MKQDLNNIIEILQSYQVKKAAFFGSYARGDYNNQSDVDILIELPKGMTLFGLVDLKIDLEKKLNKDVDLVTYRSIHPLLRERILNEQKVIYETH